MSGSQQGLADFIPQYPDVDDPNFIYDITRKKEFYDLKLPVKEETPEEAGDLLLQQLFFKRFFAPSTPNKSIILAHKPGVGKCVHPDTIVQTNVGTLKIEEIFLKYYSTLERRDDGYWTVPKVALTVSSLVPSDASRRDNPKDNKIITGKVRYLYTQYVEEELVNVQLDNGASIKITRAHHLHNGNTWTNKLTAGGPILVSDINGKFSLQKIVKITHEAYRGWVYDLEIEIYHNYIANNIVCHNTCSAVAVVEDYVDIKVGGQPRKPALVFVPGEGLMRNWRQQISKVCTKGKYVARIRKEDLKKGIKMTEELEARRLTADIARSYEIVTFETFLKKLPPDDTIKRDYSNRTIVIDEIHSIRIQPRKKSKKSITQSPVKKDYDENDVQEDDLSADDKARKDVADTNKSLYAALHHFLHTVEGCRIVGLTGTPIWDKTSDIAEVMNLILPLNEQLPTGTAFLAEFFNDQNKLVNEKRLRKALHGRISFLRSMVTSANRMEIGVTEPWVKYINVYPDGLSEFQSLYVQQAREKVVVSTRKIKGKLTEIEVTGGPVYTLAIDAAKCVYPVFNEAGDVESGIYGKEAFDKYVVEKDKITGKITGYRITNTKLIRHIKDNLSEMSTTAESVCQQIQNNPQENVFIYVGKNVTGGGGGIALGQLIKYRLGFEVIYSASQITSDKKRLAVITSVEHTTSTPKQIEDMINRINQPDNKYGQKCRVLIASEKLRLGVSLKCFRQVHIWSPHWNTSDTEQALSRVIRVGAHDALKPEERYIKIFRHMVAEIASGDEKGYNKGKGFPEDVAFTDKKTIDAIIYEIAEQKEYRNTQIYRVVKEESADCALDYGRNVLDTDTDGSRDCDFQKCNYECAGFTPNKSSKVWTYDIPENKIDYSTYNYIPETVSILAYNKENELLYPAIKVIREIIQKIKDLFRSYFSIRIETLGEMIALEDKERPLLLTAIHTIINNRVILRDRYGFMCYLKEEGNILFLDSEVTEKSSYADTSYLENPLVTQTTSLTSLLEVMEVQIDKAKVLEYCKNPQRDILQSLSHLSKIIILETAYALRHGKKKLENPRQKAVIDTTLTYLGNRLYTMSDGTVVHILYTQEFTGLSYNVVGKNIKVTGKMRYFSKNGWAYVTNPDLEKTYVDEIIKMIAEAKTTQFEDNPYGIYGTVSTEDSKFRLVIKTEEEGAKRQRKGRVCLTPPSIAFLLEIFIKNIKYLPEANPNYGKFNRRQLLDAIRGHKENAAVSSNLDARSDDELRQILTLLTMRNVQLCDILREWLAEHDLLYEI